MHTARVLTVASAAALAVQMVSAAPVYSRYRGVSLGDTVTAAAASLNMTASDIAVVHVRPSLIQQLTWRPNHFFTGRTTKPDAVAEMVLTFHLGRLARVVATYDRDRTEGLTNADLRDSFTALYGPSMLVPTTPRPRAGTTSSDQPDVIGQWGDGETLVVLSRDVYPPRIKLTVSSVAVTRQMQDAMASSVRLDALEAPTRDMIRRTSEALTQRERAERSRIDNKAAFTP
jgi:hypothetical protein